MLMLIFTYTHITGLLIKIVNLKFLIVKMQNSINLTYFKKIMNEKTYQIILYYLLIFDQMTLDAQFYPLL